MAFNKNRALLVLENTWIYTYSVNTAGCWSSCVGVQVYARTPPDVFRAQFPTSDNSQHLSGLRFIS